MDFSDYRYYLWLLISFSIVGLLLFFSLKKKWDIKKCSYIMSAVCIWSELTKMFTHVYGISNPSDRYDYSEGGYLLAKSLPFHLCSILIFVIFYITFSKNDKVKEVLKSFLTPIGIFGAFIAIILATSGIDFWNDDIHHAFDSYQSFIYHSALMWYALYLYITKQASLGLNDFKRNLLLMFLLSVSMIWINGILQIYGTNFCFVVAPPTDNLPFLNLNHGWFVYFIHLAFTGVLLETIVHLKGIINDLKPNKKAC